MREEKIKVNNENQLNAVLGEYSTLRDEILVWTRNELTIITAFPSMAIAILGYAIKSGDYTLLFVLPPLAFVGVYLWLADHCMVLSLSTYISEEIEKRKLPKIIGEMDDNSLWIGWDTFVKNLHFYRYNEEYGNREFTLAAYNCGQGNVLDAIQEYCIDKGIERTDCTWKDHIESHIDEFCGTETRLYVNNIIEWYDTDNVECVKENNPPTANAGGPYAGSINESIEFYGSGSDPDGDTIITYAWDFDNDGETDNTSQNSTYSWSTNGTYHPTLKVQDEKGDWSIADECVVNVYPDSLEYKFSANDKYYVRISNIDDIGYAYVNGWLVSTTNYHEDGGLIDVTSYLDSGYNEIRFVNKNLERGWTYGFEIIRDDGTTSTTIWKNKCGIVGDLGCNNNEYPGEKEVYSKRVALRLLKSDPLLEKFAPVLYFHEDEKYYPTEINALLDYSELRDKDKNVLVDWSVTRPVTVYDLMEHNDKDNYLDITLINQYWIKEKRALNPEYFTNYPSNIYARMKIIPGWYVLQYWFFYPYNKGTLNAHEGDWEMIEVVLDPNEEPNFVAYSWHIVPMEVNSVYWSAVKKIDTHPKVYVRRGSHANQRDPQILSGNGKIIYPKGVDIQGSNKEELKYLTIIDDQTSWINWVGKWGEQVELFDLSTERIGLGYNGGTGPKYKDIWENPITHLFEKLKEKMWKLIIGSPVNIHIYDQNDNHVGINENGTFDSEIPGVYYVDSDLERAVYITNTSNEYRIFIEATDEGEFSLDIEQKTGNETTTVQYQNISITKNTTAGVSLNQATINATMEIDLDGDDEIDEIKSYDSIETNYAPNATIILPENNSTYVYGDEIKFNGTGTDPEDGVLTNSSLMWTSDIDGLIGIGNEFNISELSGGTHTIEFMVSDTAGLSDIDSVKIHVKCPQKGDKPPCDGKVDDFELLEYIKLWSQGSVQDFDLLEAIKNWAKSE